MISPNVTIMYVVAPIVALFIYLFFRFLGLFKW